MLAAVVPEGIFVLVVSELVTCEGNKLLIGLNDFLPNALLFVVLFVMLLACVVEIGVEVKVLAPLQVELVDVAVHLFAHVHKVPATNYVVLHDDSARLLVALVGEEGALLVQVGYLLGLLGQHHFEGMLRVVHYVHSLAGLFSRNLPLTDVLLAEKLLLFLHELCLVQRVASQGLVAKPVSFLEAPRSLLLVLEPAAQVVVHHLTSLQSEVAVLNAQVRYPFVVRYCLRDLGRLQQLLEGIDRSSDCVVVVSQLVGLHLEVLDLLANPKDS